MFVRSRTVCSTLSVVEKMQCRIIEDLGFLLLLLFLEKHTGRSEIAQLVRERDH